MVEFMLKQVMDNISGMASRMRDIITHPAAHPAFVQALLIFVVITILSFEAVGIFYKLLSFPLIGGIPPKSMSSRQGNLNGPERNTLQSYGIITERNLFASTMKAVGEKQLDGGLFASGPEASAFELRGTIAGDTSFGFAILEERGANKQLLRRLGEMVGSARLIKITRNTAVLRSGGRDITLKIKQTPDGSLFSRSSGGMGASSTNTITVSRREVTEKLSDLKTVLSQAVVRPFFAGGSQEGFIISDIKPESLYNKLGLINGDIIIDVNNKRLQSADDILQLVNLMQSGGQISLSLKRNGKMETINYSFN
jgi:general secretion pathway protein C